MRLDVYVDLGNIAGYLAIGPVKKLVAETGVECRYYPIKGIVPRPISREPTLRDDDELSHYKHLRWQAKSRFERDELLRDCARLELDPVLAERQVDATLSHAACLFVASSNPHQTLAFIESIYTMSFPQTNEPIEFEEEGGILRAAFSRCRLSADEFFNDKDLWLDRFANHMEATFETGIHDSPSFILSEETFQGRQNLPLIRWRIEGQVGTPPV